MKSGFLLLFLLVLFLAFCGPASAQITQPTRFELIHNNGDQGFTTVALNEEGIALIREKRIDGPKRPWEVIHLDSALQKVWATEILLEPRLKLVGYEYSANELYFLFRQGESDFTDLYLVRIFLFSHVVQHLKVTPKLDFKLTHFIVVGNSAIFGGYVSRQPAVILYEMNSDHVRVVPGFFVSNVELLELKTNRNKTFNALLVERGNRDKRHLLLKTFDESGSMLLEDNIEIDDEKLVLAGTTSGLEHDELLLSGTWGIGSSNTKQACGIFSVLVDPYNQQPIRYLDFGALEHIFDYLPPKRAAKTRSTADRRRHAKKNPLFRINSHLIRLEETTNGFALLFELYNPSVSTNFPYNNPTSNPYYNPYYSPYYNPYAYSYSPYGFNPMMMNRYYNSPYNPYGSSGRSADVTMLQSSVVLFDHSGKLRQDFGFSMGEMKLPALEQTSDFVHAGKFTQFYKNETTVYVSTNWSPGTEAEQDTVKLQLRSSSDVVKNESNDQGGVRHWYGHFAYAWGYESIKNRTDEVADPVRYVYYVNKIKLN